MFAISAKDRCKKCHTERALRLCKRTGKGICWQCCNSLRIDLKCPSDCPYAASKSQDNPFPAFKTDNLAEARHALKSYINLWLHKANDQLEGLTPLLYCEKDREGMLKWLSGFQYPDFFPLDFMMQKLGLDIDPIQTPANPEEIAAKYLEQIIVLDHSKLRELTLNTSTLHDFDLRYAKLLSGIPFLKKVKNYSFIHTGMSEDGSQCLVFVELNHKQEWCLILRREQDQWWVRQNINGNPSLYFKQNERYQQIATLLANSEGQKALFEISEALRSYVDSPDLYYYRALYWLLLQQNEKAKEDLFNAIALDNLFSPPYMHLGLIYLNEKDYSNSRLWFAAMVDLEPENLDAANNLAIASLADNEKAKAITIWKEILKKNPSYELARKNLELYG